MNIIVVISLNMGEGSEGVEGCVPLNVYMN